MPTYKLTPRDRKKIVEAKRQCPCLKQTTLAMLFDISPARVGEILREESRERKS